MKYPRSIAVRVLTRVLSDAENLDDSIAHVSGELSSQELAWLQEVCSGTLRWKGRLDFILDSVASRKKPSGWLRKILLLAAYQLIAQDRISAGAVVSETIDEIKKREGVAPSRFANACLRRIASQGKAWRDLEFPTPEQPFSLQALAWSGLPQWIWKRLVQSYGLEWAKAYAVASFQRPQLWIRSRTPDWSVPWVSSGPIPCSWFAQEGGLITGKKGFAEGEFFVQDITSQTLVHEVSEEIKKYFPGREISGLDLCAAPGGKSVGMAWDGIQMTSTDISPTRIQLLKQTVQRTQAHVRVVAWDELDRLGQYDFVWVDAPCTGSGILRRHPDVRWLKGEKELKSLLDEQSKVLQRGWSFVKPGGVLLYSVCSVLEEEGIGQVQALGFESQVLKKWLFAPHLGSGGDGFTAFLLQKV